MDNGSGRTTRASARGNKLFIGAAAVVVASLSFVDGAELDVDVVVVAAVEAGVLAAVMAVTRPGGSPLQSWHNHKPITRTTTTCNSQTEHYIGNSIISKTPLPSGEKRFCKRDARSLCNLITVVNCLPFVPLLKYGKYRFPQVIHRNDLLLILKR